MDKLNKDQEDQVQDTTVVEEVDVDIDALFGGAGADSIMLPEEEKQEKKTLFTKSETDMTFFDNPDASAEEKEEAKEKQAEVEETITELNDLISQEEDAGNK